MFTNDEIPYALYVLASVEELPTNERDTEELAVTLISRAKELADMLPERDRATRVMGKRWFGIGGSASAREQLAAERLANAEPRLNCVPYAFFRAKFVNVNGKILKLKWAV